MAPGLAGETMARVHQDHRRVRRRGTRGHVARVLLVAGRVGDDERALIRGEEAVGHVDGDALLAFRLQAVEQQREVDLAPSRAVAAGALCERRDLVVEDLLRVVQQPSDQARLAVVHRTARDEAQHRLALVRGQERRVALAGIPRGPVREGAGCLVHAHQK